MYLKTGTWRIMAYFEPKVLVVTIDVVTDKPLNRSIRVFLVHVLGSHSAGQTGTVHGQDKCNIPELRTGYMEFGLSGRLHVLRRRFSGDWAPGSSTRRRSHALRGQVVPRLWCPLVACRLRARTCPPSWPVGPCTSPANASGGGCSLGPRAELRWSCMSPWSAQTDVSRRG